MLTADMYDPHSEVWTIVCVSMQKEKTNRTQLQPEEVLADAVYYYSRSGGFRKIMPMETVLV